MSALENPVEIYEDDSFEQVGDDLSNVKHSPLKDADKIIDLNKGEIVDKSKLSIFQQIKLAANDSGTEIRPPKPGCKKCYGRGYTGKLMNGEPLICTCLFPPKPGVELKQQLNTMSYIAQMKKKNKNLRVNVLNKTEQILKEEYNKRVKPAEETSDVSAS